jgi:hypothetical protein
MQLHCNVQQAGSAAMMVVKKRRYLRTLYRRLEIERTSNTDGDNGHAAGTTPGYRLVLHNRYLVGANLVSSDRASSGI